MTPSTSPSPTAERYLETYSQPIVLNTYGEDPSDAAYSIHSDHGERTGVAHRYAIDLAYAVHENPNRDSREIVASMRPTQEDLARWQPLVNTVGIDLAEQFAYKHQTGNINTYRQIEGNGHRTCRSEHRKPSLTRRTEASSARLSVMSVS